METLLNHEKIVWNKQNKLFEIRHCGIRNISIRIDNNTQLFKTGDLAIGEFNRTKENGYISNEYVLGFCFNRFESPFIKNLIFEWFTSPKYKGKGDVKTYGRKFENGDLCIFYKHNDHDIMLFRYPDIFRTLDFVKIINYWNNTEAIIKRIIEIKKTEYFVYRSLPTNTYLSN